MTTILTPAHYGLPAHFSEWRTGQLDCIDQIYQSAERFVGVCAPTGFGKSLAVMAASQMVGGRSLVLTSTKGLQDQYAGDYISISSDLRGKSNFSCPIWYDLDIPEGTRVDEAPCNFGFGCKKKSGGCTYFDKYRAAQRAQVVVTNYQCWLHDQVKEKSQFGDLGKFDMMFLDEAHDSPEELAQFVGFELTPEECDRCRVSWPQVGEYDLNQWSQWAAHYAVILAGRVEQCEAEVKAYGPRGRAGQVKQAAREKKLLQKLTKLTAIPQEEEWVIEQLEGEVGTVRFDPLWPQRYAEKELFRGTKKIVLVSATVRPKTLELLGVSSQDCSFREYSSSFPLHLRPLIHVPTVQMRYSMPDYELEKWLNKIDNIIRARPDRKGVIHTVSYKRAKWILEHSKFAARMMTHRSTGTDRQDTVKRFKESPASSGAVLVSPSVDTGYDFPDDECRYQVICKLPFPDLRSAVQRQRMEVDQSYRNYATAQVLVQMCGRGVRSETDWCETLVVDDQITWFIKQAKEYLPKWFRDAYRHETVLPAPMNPRT